MGHYMLLTSTTSVRVCQRQVCRAPTKMMAGCMPAAIRNSTRTSFSESPCQRDVSDAAEMLKKVARASAARACVPGAQGFGGGHGL